MNSTNLSTYQRKIRQKALDEMYLNRKIVILNRNRKQILNRLYKYKYQRKEKDKHRYFLIPEDTAIRLLKINKRTIRLLTDYEYLKNSIPFSYTAYEYSELCKLFKSIKNI